MIINLIYTHTVEIKASFHSNKRLVIKRPPEEIYDYQSLFEGTTRNYTTLLKNAIKK